MQSADDVQFGDAQLQRLARLVDNFLNGELEAVGVAFLLREGAELAGENAVIGIVDVAVDDVAGAVLPIFFRRAKSAMAPSAFKSFDSNSRSASASEMRSPATTLS